MLLKRKPKYLTKILSAALQADIYPLVNKVGVHKYQKDLSSLIYPMYLNPLSSIYQWASQSHVFTSYLNLAISSRLHPPINGFFQCFPYAPKLSTLILGEINVQTKNLSRKWRWRGRSREKLQRYSVDNCGYTISNSQVYSQGFLSQNFPGKTPYNFVGNVGLYSVGKGMRKSTLEKLQAVSFVRHS